MRDVEETPGRKSFAVPVFVATVVAAVITLGGVIGYQLWERRSDSGVVACEAMTHAKDNGNTPEPTDQKWREARDQFEKSRDLDIRSAGTSFIDYAQQISNEPKDSMVVTSLTLLPQMAASYDRLDAACNKHGHDLPAWSEL